MTIARVGLVLLAAIAFACSRGRLSETPPATPTPTPTATPNADPARPLPSPLPEVVARVNGRPIALQQILPLAKAALGKLSRSEQEKSLPLVLRNSLDIYVERELLLQEALARGISADASAVDWAYDQARRDHPGEAAWTAFLQKQASTPESFRAELRAQKTIAALIEEEVRTAPIPAQDVRAAYDENPLDFGPPGARTPPPFESVRQDVEQALRQAGRQQIVVALVMRLRSKARIELLL
jgi:hypothetical protein